MPLLMDNTYYTKYKYAEFYKKQKKKLWKHLKTYVKFVKPTLE